METLYSVYHEEVKKIYNKMVKKWQSGTRYENFGEKEYRKFCEKINNDDRLNYGQKANLCRWLSELLGGINDNSITK